MIHFLVSDEILIKANLPGGKPGMRMQMMLKGFVHLVHLSGEFTMGYANKQGFF
jgi:hypothetical protein